MATQTTTIEAIRDAMQTTVTALTPSTLAGRGFDPERAEKDFRDWCERHPQACFRRYSIEDQFDYGPPDVADGYTVEEQTTLTLTVAYPKDSRYGLQNREDLRDVIREDLHQIEDALCVNATGKLSGYHGSTSGARTVEEGESCWFASLEMPTRFRRACHITGPLDLIKTGADLAAAMGFANAPNWFWKGNAVASPTPEIIDGTYGLGEVFGFPTANSPTYQELDLQFRARTTRLRGFTEAGYSSDFLCTQDSDTPPDGYHDIGTGSVAVLHIFTLTDAVESGYLWSTGAYGNLFMSIDCGASGALRWTYNSYDAKTETVSADHSGLAVVALAVNDRNADNMQLWTGLGASTGQAAETWDESCEAALFWGDRQTFFLSWSSGQRWAATAIWHDTAAEGLNNTHRATLATYLGAG